VEIATSGRAVLATTSLSVDSAIVDRPIGISINLGIMTKLKIPILSLLVIFAGLGAAGFAAETHMAFTVSMPHPETHLFHVLFRCDGK
jgi:hypothetical protein